jgi:hypothetical protein
VILYQLVTGAVPFSADSFIAILHKHTSEEPAPPSARQPGAGITSEVDELILRCLAKKPDERIQDMATLSANLRRLAGGGLELQTPDPGAASTLRHANRASAPTLAAAAARSPVLPHAADVSAPGPGRRRRLPLAIAAAALAVAATALVVQSIGSEELPAVADASAAATPPPDAGAPGDARAPTEPEPERLRLEGEVDELAYTASIVPLVPQPRSRLDVALEIEPKDDALAQAIARGETEARFHFEYYRDHRIVAEVARDVSPEGHVRAILSLPDPGKYHVQVVLRAGAADLARLRFDLCVGAEPGAPEAAELCPRMRLP